MTKVFISYSREDRDYAHRLADLLVAKGFDVWWDWNLIGGSDFRKSIREKLAAADKAIVLWSPNSIKSSFVIDEAAFARDAGKLVPVLIEDVGPPFGFGSIHSISTTDFSKDLDAIVAAIESRSLPMGPSRTNPFRGRQLAAWLSFGAAIIAAGIGAIALLNQRGPPKETPEEALAAARRDYETVQNIYSNVKIRGISCERVRALIKALQPYQGNKRPVPKEAAYSVRRMGTKSNPTIGDVAVDRMTIIRDAKRDCF